MLIILLIGHVKAIRLPNIWARLEQGQDPELQQEPELQQTDPDVFQNPPGEEGSDSTTTTKDGFETREPTYSSSPATTIPTPDAHGALLISLLFEKGRSMIINHFKMQRRTYEKIFSILLYKPPVGMITIYSILDLIISGRVFRVYNEDPSTRDDQEGEGQEEEAQRRRMKGMKGRAYSLEERDQSYISYGAIERVRGRLCMAALADLVQEQEALNPLFAAAQSALFFQKRRHPRHQSTQHCLESYPWILATSLDALHTSCPPGGSRYDYINQLREPLAQLRAYQLLQAMETAATSKTIHTRRDTRPDVLQVATRVLELRATDALLRECRDQLLKSSHRLARTLKYWRRRVEQAKAMAVFQQRLIRETIEGDRLRLSYVEAAVRAELDRLGRVCEVLLAEEHPNKSAPGRPKEMSDTLLIEALKMSGCEARGGLQKEEEMQQNPQGITIEDKKKWRSTWRLPKLSRYALRIEKGWLQVKHMEKSTFIGGPSAIHVLMEDKHLGKWYNDAAAWIHTAKQAVCDVLEGTLDASVSEHTRHTHSSAHDIDWIREAWEFGTTNAKDSSDKEKISIMVYNCTKYSWSTVLHLVEDVSVFRRVGEGRTLAFQDLSIVGWLSSFDFFGIPSALTKIYMAYLLHAWLAPRWHIVLAWIHNAWQTIVTIFMTRFWEPGKDVILDILNRGKSSMLDGFNLRMEEDSLDMMLKEMNFGDGTAATRGQALEAATREYEEDFKSGLFTNLASGQLVRLLLIQMQQVKVGMLQAVDDIDVLMQANKLNMRVLAIVPAIFLVTVVTRTFARHLYNFRSRDLRPINRVHDEMTEQLHRMQSILLLASEGRVNDDETASVDGRLGAATLGEFAVRMHRYLVLLDYCSPRPFPKKQCDELHRSLREVFGTIETQPPDEVHQPTLATPVALLNLVMEGNRRMQKYL